jgi:hypothetical protein
MDPTVNTLSSPSTVLLDFDVSNIVPKLPSCDLFTALDGFVSLDTHSKGSSSTTSSPVHIPADEVTHNLTITTDIGFPSILDDSLIVGSESFSVGSSSLFNNKPNFDDVIDFEGSLGRQDDECFESEIFSDNRSYDPRWQANYQDIFPSDLYPYASEKSSHLSFGACSGKRNPASKNAANRRGTSVKRKNVVLEGHIKLRSSQRVKVQEHPAGLTERGTSLSAAAASSPRMPLLTASVKQVLSGLKYAVGCEKPEPKDKEMYSTLVQAAHAGLLPQVDFDETTLGTPKDHLNSVDRAVADGFIVRFPTMDAFSRAIEKSNRDVFANRQPLFFTFVNSATRCKDSAGSVITKTAVVVVVMPADPDVHDGAATSSKLRAKHCKEGRGGSTFANGTVVRISSLGGNPEFFSASTQPHSPEDQEHDQKEGTEVQYNTGIDKKFTLNGKSIRLRTGTFKLVRAGTQKAKKPNAST